jgi:hypothetical protein
MPIVTHATARRHVPMLGLILRRVRDHHFRTLTALAEILERT